VGHINPVAFHLMSLGEALHAYSMSASSHNEFANIEVLHVQVTEWEAMSTAPFKRGGEWHSVYWPEFSKGGVLDFPLPVYGPDYISAPMQAAIFQELCHQESDVEQHGDLESGNIAFMHMGLQIQTAQ
jgi:hypothetical protein